MANPSPTGTITLPHASILNRPFGPKREGGRSDVSKRVPPFRITTICPVLLWTQRSPFPAFLIPRQAAEGRPDERPITLVYPFAATQSSSPHPHQTVSLSTRTP